MATQKRRADDKSIFTRYRRLIDIGTMITLILFISGVAMWVQAKDDAVNQNTIEINSIKDAITCLEAMKIDIATTKKDIEAINAKQDGMSNQLSEVRSLLIQVLRNGKRNESH